MRGLLVPPLVLPLVLVLVLVWAVPAQARRVVSLNLCTDQYLLLLAPEQAVGVTFLARDPSLSVVVAQAARVPALRADAESVLRLKPDLVLAAPFGAQGTLALLERRGIAVRLVALPQDFEGIRAETREIAALLGVERRGEALLEAMAADLSHRARRPLRALALAPRGYSSGPGSLTDAVLRAAGLVNVGEGGRLPLELIVSHPPDVLVLERDPAFPSLATDFLRHPALAGLARVQLPPALTVCAGPWTAHAVALLAR